MYKYYYYLFLLIGGLKMDILDKVEIIGIGLEKEETEKFKENLKKELDNRKKDNEQERKKNIRRVRNAN